MSDCSAATNICPVPKNFEEEDVRTEKGATISLQRIPPIFLPGAADLSLSGLALGLSQPN